MKETIIKINELVYPDYEKRYFEEKEDINLEMLLVAFDKRIKRV